MRILGVRAAPKVTSFVVYCTEESVLKCVDVIKIPAILDTPEKLKYVRNNILDILNLYNVELAAIRVTETNAENLSIDRLYIEAVIQEAFSSSELNKYYTIRKSGMKSSLNLSESAYKEILKSQRSINGIDNSEFTAETNEAFLAALTAEVKGC
ncbi:TPA: hypothetical protein ACIJSX_000912 [Klebsiella pneumoniae]|uniref:hypothetical protein n=1 Tax=Klebsiella pneumoniae complex TaxID=3390273 RepID=UPI000D6429DA|nr:hypothetical protein [Klebsiella pneumoniae]MEA4578189.1 hypothetical protein [Klebsiella pneumoniae]HBW7831579.1 crossover junction endodeoxyribonuclease RuvC [Klebsiella pneumoniae]HCF8768447.1 hypothetical protein [Klebsiella pneumoniae]HDZ9724363.1 hypothetical protein [Klebsiella pneumoniae]